MAPSPAGERLAGLLHEVVTAGGLEVEDVKVTSVGRRRVVTVVVDLPADRTGSADLDDVAEVSRSVSRELDRLDGLGRVADLVGTGEYALEVTTPGVDRPLTERRHWLRARTRLVRVVGTDGRTTTGRLLEVDDDGVVLDTPAGPARHGWAGVAKGRVEVEFRKDAGPGDDGTR